MAEPIRPDRLQFGFGRRLPVVLQAEAAECGMACLAMVLAYYGHRVDLGTMRRRHALSLKGMTLRNLIDLAGTMGLATRALRVELVDLGRLRLPCVLHWGLNHFVVLQRAGRRAIVIHDPARGRRRVNLDEASREFTGVALESQSDDRLRQSQGARHTAAPRPFPQRQRPRAGGDADPDPVARHRTRGDPPADRLADHRRRGDCQRRLRPFARRRRRGRASAPGPARARRRPHLGAHA